MSSAPQPNLVLLKSSRGELSALAGLSLIYVAFDGLVGPEAYDYLNFYGPVMFLATLGYGMWRTATAHPAGIWISLFWLRVATAVYYGFGAVVPLIVNDTTLDVMNHFYQATPAEMLRVNTITTLSILVILLTSNRVMSKIRPVVVANPGRNSSRAMLRWGVLVGGLGLVVKYQIALPYSFGLVAWQVPGFFLQLSMLSSVGIYLVGSWAFAHSRLIFAAVAAFAVFEAFVGLITFSKTELTFTLVMIGLATVHRGASIWRVAPIAAVLFMTFATASPIVDFGRSVLFQRYNSVTGAGFDERVDIVASYFAGGREQFLADPFRSEFQGGLARLSYMNQASFAVHLYDSGMPGDSLNAIAVVLVPRFLWPDKPSLNYLGAGFTEKATGGTTSLSWPGRYAEVYWNFGWWGILFLMPPLGFVYALLSRYTLWVFAAQRWAHFPVVLMSMKYGIDIAGPYATSGVGGLSYIIVAHFASRLLERLVDRATNRWSAPAVARRDPRFA